MNFTFAKPWNKLGIAEDTWKEIPEEDQQRLVEHRFTRKPCAICRKSVMVLKTHTGETYCGEHAGTWKEPSR